MCMRMRQKSKQSDYFDAMEWGPESITAAGYVPQENVSPGSKPLVLHGMAGASEMATCLHWGYNRWRRGSELENSHISRRSLRRNALWSPLLKNGRIVVPADGWYEWSGEEPDAQTWYLRPKNRQPLFIAALTAWRPGQAPSIEHGFGLITGGFGSGIADPLARNPIILNPEDATSWLDQAITPADAMDILFDGRSDSEFEYHEVNQAVDDPGYQGADASEPLHVAA